MYLPWTTYNSCLAGIDGGCLELFPFLIESSLRSPKDILRDYFEIQLIKIVSPTAPRITATII